MRWAGQGTAERTSTTATSEQREEGEKQRSAVVGAGFKPAPLAFYTPLSLSIDALNTGRRSEATRRHSSTWGKPDRMNSSKPKAPVLQQLIGDLVGVTHDGRATVDPHRRDAVPQVRPQPVVGGFRGLGPLTDHGRAGEDCSPLTPHHAVGTGQQLVGSLPRLRFHIPNDQVRAEAERWSAALGLEVGPRPLQVLGRPVQGLDPRQVDVSLTPCQVEGSIGGPSRVEAGAIGQRSRRAQCTVQLEVVAIEEDRLRCLP